MRKKKTLTFVAWDGEGANDKYILLRNSRNQSIKNVQGLSSRSCLRFLLQSATNVHENVKHVIFGGSYDVNMLLCDLSREDIYRLWTYGHVEWNEYTIRYIHRKSFTISLRNTSEHRQSEIQSAIQPMDIETESGNHRSITSIRRRTSISITLWDVFGFFQSTFVDAIRQYLPDFDQETVANIIAHKKQRGSFVESDLNEIETYCKQEIDALVQIMEKLHHAMETAELTVSRWDGAGAIAQALLRKYRIKDHMQDFAVTAPDVHRAAWRAYAGGRIECLQYGHHNGVVFHADINSAYPTATLTLPSFAGGCWRHTQQFVRGVFGLWSVRFDFCAYRAVPFYPFFYRAPTGAICYPICGQGWYWQPEVEAALQWMSDGVDVKEGWIWQPTKQESTISSDIANSTGQMALAQIYPFAFVQHIYQQRLRYKKERNAAQKVLKLGMNSLYGKLAQQVGYKKNEKPAFQQVEWAGYITSATRAKLFVVGMQHPDSVVMFATDGIFSTQDHDVEKGADLGQWEVTTHDEMIVAQSGVYWYRDGDEWTDKFRGFDREDLTKEKILATYEQAQWKLAVCSTRFLTMGAALQSADAWTKWHTWPQSSRSLSLLATGTKRTDSDPWWTTEHNPAHHLYQTRPLINEYALAGIPSQAYVKTDDVILAKRLDREAQDGFI